MKKYYFKIIFLFLFFSFFFMNFIFGTKISDPQISNLKTLKKNINIEKTNLFKEKNELKNIKKEKNSLNKKIDNAKIEIKNLEKKLIKENENYKNIMKNLDVNKNKEKTLGDLFLLEIENFYKKNFVLWKNKKNLYEFLNFFDDELKKELNLKIFKMIIFENCKNLNNLKILQNKINSEIIKSEAKMFSLNNEKEKKNNSKNKIISKNKENDIIIANKTKKIKKFEENIKNLEKDAKKLENLVNNLIKNKNINKNFVSKSSGNEKKIEFKKLIQTIGKIYMPIYGEIIVNFGKNKYPKYSSYYLSNGIQIKSKNNFLVKNVFPGKVVFCDNFGIYGKTLIIEHKHDIFTVYAYLDEYFVKINQNVFVGDILGKVDKSKKTLYFELRYKGEKLDPKIWIKNI